MAGFHPSLLPGLLLLVGLQHFPGSLPCAHKGRGIVGACGGSQPGPPAAQPGQVCWSAAQFTQNWSFNASMKSFHENRSGQERAGLVTAGSTTTFPFTTLAAHCAATLNLLSEYMAYAMALLLIGPTCCSQTLGLARPCLPDAHTARTRPIKETASSWTPPVLLPWLNGSQECPPHSCAGQWYASPPKLSIRPNPP